MPATDGIFNNLPLEYQQQLDELQRRKMLAETMAQRGMQFQPAQSQGTMASKTPLAAVLAQVAGGLMGQYGANKAQGGIRDVQRQAQTEQTGELTRLQALGPDEFARQGQASKFPQIQALAKAAYDAKQKRLEAGSKIIGDSGDPSGAIAALARDTLPAEYKQPEIPQPQAATMMGPDGKPISYLVSKNRKGESTPHFPPRGVNVSVDTKQEGALAGAMGKALPERAQNVTEQAAGAIKQMQSADRIAELVRDPEVITGFGANPALFIGSLGAKLGLTGADAPAKTQALLSEIAGQTLARVPELPGAITEKERPFLEQAAAGQISFTPESLQRLADISRMMAHNKLIQLHRTYGGIMQTPGAADAGVDKVYPFPTGWNFSADPKRFQETGEGTNQYRYIGGLGSTTQAAPSMPGPNDKVLTIDKLTPEQKAALRAMLGQ